MKTISKIKYILIIMTIGITFFSCENNVEEETISLGENEPCNLDVSFSNDVKPIVDNNCIRCHGGSQAPDLRTYAGISSNAARVKTQVVNRTMPQGGSLTNEQIELIKCWVESGALNN